MFTGSEETICSRCAHLDVCKYKEELLNAQETVNNITISRDRDKEDGIRLIKLRDIPWIKRVRLECIYFQGRESNVSKNIVNTTIINKERKE